MNPRRPCKGVLMPGSHGDWPFIRPCPEAAMVGEYCAKCAQKRIQNDSIRKVLIPNWAEIGVVGDPNRKGRGKPVISLPDWARPMNQDVLDAQEAKRQAEREAAKAASGWKKEERQPGVESTAQPRATSPEAADVRVAVVGSPVEAPDPFEAARRMLAGLSKID